MPVDIACPNLSLDRTIEVDTLRVGGIHRSRRADARGGGKGVNVARALASLGGAPRVVGILAGRTGTAVRGLLEDEGVGLGAVEIAGETRSCLTVLTAAGVTVFNESGPDLDARGWRRYLDLVEDHLREGSVFVCAGSFPPGAPDDGAARLLDAARDRGCTTVIDTSGVQLERALDGAPDLIKPNLHEALVLLGRGGREPVDAGPEALPRAAEAAIALRERGARSVVVSAGAAGAALATEDGTVSERPPPVRVVNPIGAGDCMVAGLVARLERGLPLDREALRFAVVVGSAGCETFSAGVVDRARVEALLAQTASGRGGP